MIALQCCLATIWMMQLHNSKISPYMAAPQRKEFR